MAVITPANSNTKTSRPTSLQERESFKRVEIKIGPCVAFAGWSPSRTIISHVERVGFCIGGHLAIHVNVNTHVRIHTHIFTSLSCQFFPVSFHSFFAVLGALYGSNDAYRTMKILWKGRSSRRRSIQFMRFNRCK